MQIGFFGGGRQALAGLNALHQHWNVVFVRPRFMDDPVLSGFCHPNVVPVLDVDDVNAPVAIGHIRDFAPDLIVSINERSILKRELRAIAKLGAINLHNGLLPRQGGGGGAYAAIVNGEPCGMTIHFMDDGIDTGDIIIQREIPVSPTMTMH